ncbi:hypothetical protein AJ78_04068 [Emergomyces pasteurianus Ep9510]|uniref:Uncharacterized protein n=1 Tax=Emergomyces pasteurianus Ep9510 TaxID=1447872 RepID=A0A1J9QIH9_9EURO|nr:hypothetical protein AJ78_04068 [Emergomyces pasteurianus Ep9510]
MLTDQSALSPTTSFLRLVLRQLRRVCMEIRDRTDSSDIADRWLLPVIAGAVPAGLSTYLAVSHIRKTYSAPMREVVGVLYDMEGRAPGGAVNTVLGQIADYGFSGIFAVSTIDALSPRKPLLHALFPTFTFPMALSPVRSTVGWLVPPGNGPSTGQRRKNHFTYRAMGVADTDTVPSPQVMEEIAYFWGCA